jgi:hypothetical protein
MQIVQRTKGTLDENLFRHVCSRDRRRRCRQSGRPGDRRGSRRHCRCGDRRRHCRAQQACGRFRPVRAKVRERQCRDEKHRRKYCRRTRQKVRRAGCAEQTARCTTTESSAHIGAFAVLQQDEANDPKCRQQLNDDNQCFQIQHHTHLSLYLTAPHKVCRAGLGHPRQGALLNRQRSSRPPLCRSPGNPGLSTTRRRSGRRRCPAWRTAPPR